MRSTSFLCFGFLLLACSGAVDQTDVIAEQCAEPPPVSVTARSGEILQLDAVQFGEKIRDQPGTFSSLGMNLDGLCSSNDESTHACVRSASSSRNQLADGDGGIDNSFGRNLLPMLALLDERPSEAASGSSYLVLEGGGRATLHVGSRVGQIIASIPIASVRLEDDRLDGLVVLAGVIPPEELIASVRARANALTAPPDTELCGTNTLEGILSLIRQAPDVRLDLTPNRAEPCDGISIGMRFRATPVTTMPALPPTCDEQIAQENAKDGG